MKNSIVKLVECLSDEECRETIDYLLDKIELNQSVENVPEAPEASSEDRPRGCDPPIA